MPTSNIAKRLNVQCYSAEMEVGGGYENEIITIKIEHGVSLQDCEEYIQSLFKDVEQVSIIEIQDINLNPVCLKCIKDCINFTYQKLIISSKSTINKCDDLIDSVKHHSTDLIDVIKKCCLEVKIYNYKLLPEDIILFRSLIATEVNLLYI